MIFFSILTLILTLLEGSVTTIPLMLIFFLISFTIFKKSWIFYAAFLSGLLLDTILLNNIGETSLFFTIFLFIVMLCDRKFDIQTFPFIFFSAFTGSFIYLIFFNNSNALTQSLISAFIAICLFWVLVQSDKFNLTKREIGL